ncbi:hypothetical protein PEC301899_33880 [Pectobacterium carotovorum subsp. carotovorum]|nr:hypothetical protein PEC301899_33880 [Pectobacterium carotovorum subsp. carotovorum]
MIIVEGQNRARMGPVRAHYSRSGEITASGQRGGGRQTPMPPNPQ